MIGTITNVIAVLLGCLVGLLIHSRLSTRFISIVFQAIGLFTFSLGISMAIKTEHFLILVFSIVIGAVCGEWLDLEKRLNDFGDYVKVKLKSESHQFTEGMITAFLLFCVGSMTVLGAIEEGLGGKPNLLIAKSVMDGIAAIALTSSMGIGVMFSVIPLLIYQGGLTLFASFFETILNEAVVLELSAVGGLLLIGLGINILEIKKLKIINMLPSLIVVVILSFIFL